MFVFTVMFRVYLMLIISQELKNHECVRVRLSVCLMLSARQEITIVAFKVEHACLDG